MRKYLYKYNAHMYQAYEMLLNKPILLTRQGYDVHFKSLFCAMN